MEIEMTGFYFRFFSQLGFHTSASLSTRLNHVGLCQLTALFLGRICYPPRCSPFSFRLTVDSLGDSLYQVLVKRVLHVGEKVQEWRVTHRITPGESW